VPSRILQETLYQRDLVWLDYLAYLAHGFWFGVPFAFGLILMIFERRRLAEFLGWTLVLFHLSALVFLVFPVRPPWMEPGIERVLLVRNFGHYAEIDNNPAAAFPSLHAGLPALVAIFYFTRCRRRLRFYGWLAVGFTAVISLAIVYMGEHWVLDVLGGYLVAGLTAWLCTNSKVRGAVRAIPGDPLGLMIRFNQLVYPEARPVERAAPAIAGEPTRAAA
jgi:membrane-associated phospholipid phosphatase